MSENISEILIKAVETNRDKIKPCTKILKGVSYPRFQIPITNRIRLVSNTTLFDDGVEMGYCGILDATEISQDDFDGQAFANMIVRSRPDTKKISSNDVANVLHLKPYTFEIKDGRVGRKPVDTAEELGKSASTMTLEDFAKKAGVSDNMELAQKMYHFFNKGNN